MKSLFAGVRLLLQKKHPASQLAEIETRIRAAETEMQRLDTEVARRALAVMTGDGDAARVVEECEEQKQRLCAELSILRHGADQIRKQITEDEAARSRAKSELFPAECAAIREAILKLDDEFEQSMATAAAVLSRRKQLGADLARKTGSPVLRNAEQTFSGRVKASVARQFVINKRADASPQDPNWRTSDEPAFVATEANNLLGIKGHFVGERAHWSLVQHDTPTLDEECPFFTTEAAALSAQQRQHQRSTPTVVEKIGAAWTLIRLDQFFVDSVDAKGNVTVGSGRAAAELTVRASARSRELVVLPHGPGWLVLEKPVAEARDAATAPIAPEAA
ncbi:MAG: hypothetical protein WA184_25725 [Stellaceae bacterium]